MMSKGFFGVTEIDRSIVLVSYETESGFEGVGTLVMRLTPEIPSLLYRPVITKTPTLP